MSHLRKKHDAIRHALQRLFACTLICLLPGCLSDIRDQLDECTANTKITYPSDKPMPMGQPFKDILACMQTAGYVIDYEGPCKFRDYTSIIGDPYCYRPSGAISGYFHDIATTLR